MNLDQYLDDELLIVCPSLIKKKILDQYHDKLYSFKFMTKQEFKNHYYFSYDNKTINYLMENYHYHIDVCKTYLESLYVINIDQKYQNKKLRFLKELKQELIANHLLEFDHLFKEFLKKKKVIVIQYDELEKYEKEMFSDAIIIQKESKKLNAKVVRCQTLEDEVLFVIEKITELLKENVNLNHIYLSNVSDEYLYTINRLFSYFHLPINLDMKESIYGTKTVSDYLSSKKIPSFQTPVSIKLIDVVNRLVELEDSKYYQDFLIDEFKHTYLKAPKLKNAINILHLGEDIIGDDDYLFVLGFNQDIVPKTYKDEDFITDSMKNEVNLYSTQEKNIMAKENILRALSNVKNLYISYKEQSNFNQYLPSSLIEELDLDVIQYHSKKVYSSNLYNQLVLGNLLDNYYKYGEDSSLLRTLIHHYDIEYNTYNNQFTGINHTNLRKYMNDTLRLSYTSLNAYHLCSFQYYIQYILKINPFTDTFSIFIGNLFHYIFSVMYRENFNFDLEWDNYIKKYDLSIKEKFFLKNLKIKLEEDIQMMKDLEMLSEYKNVLTEQEITIPFKPNVFFTGKIDKIKYQKNVDDTYFAVIDYKTGNIHTSINCMKYGLNMQLPIYLYLLSNSHLFTSPIFTGMYFQKVLFPSFKWESNKNYKDIKQNNLKLQGYSTDEVDRLVKFDRSYENSEYIKSMKINKDSSFSKHSKVLSDNEIYHILKYTDKVIDDTSNHIFEGDFQVNPKIIEKEIACEHCKFKDVCFVHHKDYVYLEKPENLDFLGGEIDG